MSRVLLWVADTRTTELGPKSMVGRVGQRVIYRLTPLKDDWWLIDFRLPGSCPTRMDGEVIDWCEAHFREWIKRFSKDLDQQWKDDPHG